MSDEQKKQGEYIYALKDIPGGLIEKEIETPSDYRSDIMRILGYYKIYKEGAEFKPEGSNGDYIPSQTKYKKCARLINKEARFLFSQMPDIIINPKGDVSMATDETKDMITTIQEYVKSVCDENNLGKQLLQSAKDCFIAGRIGAILNFNSDDGVKITFLKATEFVYETKLSNPDELTKFVAFIVVKDVARSKLKRIFKKKYYLQDKMVDGKKIQKCYVIEELYDGLGNLIETVTPETETEFNRIPAVVITNDGLLGELKGESEIEGLFAHESDYSKLSNTDMDNERKNMNPVKYVVDMQSESTKGLSTAPGSFWDLTSDQNLENASPQVGNLESSMSYSAPLQTTLKRIEMEMHEQLDIPDVTLESMQGIITSGKALKAIYWPLQVRCNEKLVTWIPKLKYLISLIIDGAVLYPNCITKYTEDSISPVNYEIFIDPNYPLPEDAEEEKQMDLSEISQQTMSRKYFLKKWRELTDAEADEEIEQIAREKQMLEESAFSNPGSFEV